MAEILPYAIEEVVTVDSPYLPGMLRWLNRLFPEYTPQFETILTPDRFSAVGTKALAWQLWQFGGLPEIEFTVTPFSPHSSDILTE